jgi:hypothetical protein
METEAPLGKRGYGTKFHTKWKLTPPGKRGYGTHLYTKWKPEKETLHQTKGYGLRNAHK